MVVSVCFFFKHKTADELRSGDWSSDVCSSDLRIARPFGVKFEIGEDAGKLDETRIADRLPRRGGFERRQFVEIVADDICDPAEDLLALGGAQPRPGPDRKSTRLNSSHYCAHRMPSTA